MVILILASIYLFPGFFFAIAFMIKGVEKIDEAAKNASPAFRFIILPGTVIFWPWLLRKWVKSDLHE